MPRYFDEACSLILRQARKQHPCAGNGASGDARRWSPECDERQHIIKGGEPYVEYVGEVPAFQSGTRHCLECHAQFWEDRPIYQKCVNPHCDDEALTPDGYCSNQCREESRKRGTECE